MKNPKPEFYSLADLIRKLLAANNGSLYTTVFSSFLRIPDKILSSHQKIILIVLMYLSRKTESIRLLGSVDIKFDIPIYLLGELAGLDRFQTSREIAKLPAAIKLIKQKKLFAPGEDIIFNITDETGKAIKKCKRGTPPYFDFSYTQPAKIMGISGRISNKHEKNTNALGLQNDTEEIPHTKIKPAANDADDIKALKEPPEFISLKKAELSRLTNHYRHDIIRGLLKYPLVDVVRGVDYYFYLLQQKSATGETINASYLKKIFSEKWFDDYTSPRDKLKDYIDYLYKIKSEILQALKKRNYEFKYLQSVDSKSKKYHYSQFASKGNLSVLLDEMYYNLTPDSQLEVKAASDAVHNLLPSKMMDETVNRQNIKNALVIMHLNLI